MLVPTAAKNAAFEDAFRFFYDKKYPKY